jgi:HSP20 family protein
MFPSTRRNHGLERVLDGDFRRVRRELDDTFRRVLGHDGGTLASTLMPLPISTSELEDRYLVDVDLPGVAESEVEVTLHEGKLQIRWDRPAPEGKTHLYNGRRFGRGEHVLILPEGTTTEGIEATMSNGVLSIVVPKVAEAKPLKIDVRNI